jgi:succinate dehydrogenase / fumarate reductase, cytochrome b subunit
VGWINPYHYNLERWAYTFQRITGLAILLYVIGHIGDTSFFVGGPFGSGPNPNSWRLDLSITENALGHVILMLVVLVVVYHGVNGIRLILVELGIIFSKPTKPQYPYKPMSLRAMQQHLIWAAIILAILAMVWSGWILF